MKHKRMMAGILAGLLIAAAAPGYTEDGLIVRTSALKQNPSFASKTLQDLPPGTVVRLDKRNGGWQQVTVLPQAKQQGWVRAYQVRTDLEQGGQKPVVQQKESGGVLSGLSNLSRRTAGLFGQRETSASDSLTATIGVRGLSEEDLNKAKPNPAELDKLHGFAADSGGATQYASAASLKKQRVDHLPEPAKGKKK